MPTPPRIDVGHIAPRGSYSAETQRLHGTKSPYRAADREEYEKRTRGIVGVFNQAATLREGHLLVNYLGRNQIFQVDPQTGGIEFLCSLGHEQSPFLWRVQADSDGYIYACLSGSRDGRSGVEDAVFGLSGAVTRIDLRRAQVETLVADEATIDPCSLQILDDRHLVISDFSGFGSTGSIYTIDKLTGDRKVLATAGSLQDPVSAFLDSDGALFVANAYMHYFYPERRSGLEKDDGELLRIDRDGRETILISRAWPPGGSIVGVWGSNTPDDVIVVRGDWPLMECGSVVRVSKDGKTVHTLLSAAPGHPRFYSTHVDVSGDILWVGESYHKQILGVDLTTNRIVHELDFGAVMGGFSGVASSFEGIESVSVVPPQR